ncbi:MAG: EamA family transporter, partial [Blautia obeum]
MKKETVPVRNSLLLLLTATIWGIAFVAQSVSMDYIGGFTFNSIRSLIGSLTLLPVILLLSKPKSAEEKNRPQTSSKQKILITGGICCGNILCLASNFQQFGIKYTTVG